LGCRLTSPGIQSQHQKQILKASFHSNLVQDFPIFLEYTAPDSKPSREIFDGNNSFCPAFGARDVPARSGWQRGRL
jgi:hypothetical protein